LNRVEFREHVPLAPYTTLRVGGPARWFAEAASEEDILEALRFARDKSLPLFVLGGGSNLLVADAGFDGLVLRIALRGVERDGDTLHAAAGEDWDALVLRSLKEGLAGIECLSGIPGTVGGTPVQNVGAYGQEVSSTVVEVAAIEIATGQRGTFPGAECGFTYRTSRFNLQDAGRYILTRVSYKLKPDTEGQVSYPEVQRTLAEIAKPTLADVREAVLQLRRGKGMVLVEGDPDSRSAGSFFKNPIVTEQQAEAIAAEVDASMPRFAGPSGGIKLSAAWLIEHAGFCKGMALGNAAISSKHTLALVNRGSATSAEILQLRDRIAGAVQTKFGITLQQEPVNVPGADHRRSD